MKIYKIVISIIDFDELGADAIVQTLENQKYPNYCISPHVMKIDERDIGEWDDSHPLNHSGTADAEYRRLFEQASEGTHDGENKTVS